MLVVKQANFLATIQDDGRAARHMGFTSGGAMDKTALQIANQLVDNPAFTAAIEITYGAFAVEMTQSCWVGLAGADLHATVADNQLLPWQNYHLNAGDVIKFTHPKVGLRAYLAVQGGIHTAPFLGSQSAVVREGLPGLCGRALARGDELTIATKALPVPLRHRYYVEWHQPIWVRLPDDEAVTIDFYPTYQWQRFAKRERDKLSAACYTIQPSSNRMGYRLAGEAIQYQGQGLVSEGICEGSIQVPPDGQPIILMRDHPSVGGYPKLGVVTERCMDILAQLPPERIIQLRPVIDD